MMKVDIQIKCDKFKCLDYVLVIKMSKEKESRKLGSLVSMFFEGIFVDFID